MLYKSFFEIKPSDNKFIYLVKAILERFGRHGISQTGGQLAYFFLLSLSPFLIFLNVLISSFNIQIDTALAQLSPILPSQITNLILSYRDNISANQDAGLLSIGIIITLYSASKSVSALTHAINRAYDITRKRSFIRQLILSMLFTVCIAIILILSILLITAGSNFLNHTVELFKMPDHFVRTIKYVTWITAAAILFAILSAIYYIIPNKRVKFCSVIPGTIFSTLSFALFNFTFSAYINHFTKYSIIYGSTGAIIILLLWLYFTGIVLVLGAEINSILELPKEKS